MALFEECDVDWDQLSVGSNESFFDRTHSDHEPLEKALLKSRLEQINKENEDTQSNSRTGRSTAAAPKDDDKKPVLSVKPRGKSVPRQSMKPRATIPITPNVLKKRRVTRVNRNQPEPFVFKAKPAPAFKSTVNRVTTHFKRLTVATKDDQVQKTITTQSTENRPPIVPSTARASRRETTRPEPMQLRPRSRSVPSNKPPSTIPVTPMVLKRHIRRPAAPQNKPEMAFKAKPAEVLHRQPFKPKLGHNNNNNQSTCSLTSTGSTIQTKPFEFCLEKRAMDRKLFNHRTTDALEKKNKKLEEDKQRVLDEKYAAARQLTKFRATRNPFK